MTDLFDGLFDVAGNAVGKVVKVAVGGAGILLEGAGHAAGAVADTISPVLSDALDRAGNYAFGGFKDPLQMELDQAINDSLDFSDTFEQDQQPQQAHEKHRQEALRAEGDAGAAEQPAR
jgi:hypothetical protein